MTKDEALQMCLEYIETNAHERRHVRWAIKDALAQPEQESTNWHVIDPTGNVVATEKDAIHGWARLGGFKPTLEVLLAHHESGWRVVPAPPLPVQEPKTYALLYPQADYVATPDERPWVGLTNDEKSELWEISRAALPRYATYASLVEAKLKEKNK